MSSDLREWRAAVHAWREVPRPYRHQVADLAAVGARHRDQRIAAAADRWARTSLQRWWNRLPEGPLAVLGLASVFGVGLVAVRLIDDGPLSWKLGVAFVEFPGLFGLIAWSGFRKLMTQIVAAADNPPVWRAAFDPEDPYDDERSLGIQSGDFTDTIPSPQLVTAWLILRNLPPERVPLWASYWLAAGYDGPALAELAGLSGDDPREVRDLLGAALVECGVPTADVEPDDLSCRRAAALTAFVRLAERYLDGQISDIHLLSAVDRLVGNDPDTPVADFPLARLYSVDDDWYDDFLDEEGEAEAATTADRLSKEIRQACHEQLRAARTPAASGP